MRRRAEEWLQMEWKVEEWGGMGVMRKGMEECG